MPKIKTKLGEFVLNWTEDQNFQLLSIANNVRYRKICKPHKQGYRTITYLMNWKLISEDNALKGLPKLSVRQYSKRLSLLIAKLEDKNFTDRRRKLQKEYDYDQKIYKNATIKKKKLIWKTLPDELKEKCDYKQKQIWTSKQQKLLIKIVKDYVHKIIDWKKLVKDLQVEKLPACYQTVKSICSLYNLISQYNNHVSINKTQKRLVISLTKKYKTKPWINWIELMKDERIKLLPKKYHNNLHLLRKYYWCISRADRNTEEYKEKRRKEALDYKKRTLEKYNSNRTKREKIIRKVVNEHLNKQVRISK